MWTFFVAKWMQNLESISIFFKIEPFLCINDVKIFEKFLFSHVMIDVKFAINRYHNFILIDMMKTWDREKNLTFCLIDVIESRNWKSHTIGGRFTQTGLLIEFSLSIHDIKIIDFRCWWRIHHKLNFFRHFFVDFFLYQNYLLFFL